MHRQNRLIQFVCCTVLLSISITTAEDPLGKNWDPLPDLPDGNANWYDDHYYDMEVTEDDCFYAATAASMLSQGWPWAVYLSGIDKGGFNWSPDNPVQTPSWDNSYDPYFFNLDYFRVMESINRCLDVGNNCSYDVPLSPRDEAHTRTSGNSVGAEVKRMSLAAQRGSYRYIHQDDPSLTNIMRSKFGYPDALLVNDQGYSKSYEEFLLRTYLDQGQMLPGGDEWEDGITLRSWYYDAVDDAYKYVVQAEYDNQQPEGIPWEVSTGEGYINYAIGRLNPFIYGSSTGTVRRYYYGDQAMAGSGGGKSYWHRFMICNPMESQRTAYCWISRDGVNEGFTSDYVDPDSYIFTDWVQFDDVWSESYLDIELKMYGSFGDVGIIPMDDREFDTEYKYEG